MSNSDLSSSNEIVHEILDLFRIYKDGTIERLKGYEIIPPSIDPHTGVQSKDVVISPETGLSARLYIPKPPHQSQSHHKLPLLVYFHGGGFCIESPFSPLYHNYLNSLVSAANIVAVSVNYRRSPEHPLPIPFDDSWAAVNWAIGGGDDWVKDLADLNRVFFAGDSAGGNITYRMGMRAGSEGLSGGAKLEGVILVQPWFGGEELIGSEAENLDFVSMTRTMWRIVWPSLTGFDDPVINPNKDPKMADMGCERMLVCVAEKDPIRDRGCHYYQGLRRSGWKGTAEIVESAGEEHVFHLFNPTSDNAIALLNLFVSFFNQ